MNIYFILIPYDIYFFDNRLCGSDLLENMWLRMKEKLSIHVQINLIEKVCN